MRVWSNLFPVIVLLLCNSVSAQQIITEQEAGASFTIYNNSVVPNRVPAIYTDENDAVLVRKAAGLLQHDLELVTGEKPAIRHLPVWGENIIVIGTLESRLIKQLIQNKKLDVSKIRGKWEAYQMQVLQSPFKGIGKALVIVGSDRRGAAYGVFEVSRQMGVSPWYWWADVPVKKKTKLFVKNAVTIDSPLVKYRGIFINDEAPALSGWSKEKFGGFNHLFYEKVFELMLRLKSNYLWPAMWGNAFYDDDSLNKQTADDYGIVIGTSHHEPLMRAHDEWRRYGKGKWNYDSNEVRLKEFWRGGMQRTGNTEKIVSIGMRGDGDEPMTQGTAIALLERIVKDQREIIGDVTGKPADQTPQLWALYKEVQDYYDKGMRVPDDVTLLLCDDNWGNLRKLPKLDEPPRKGGYGIYYHFDYVGGPRNYKWINTNPIARVWEQMHLAWEYKARQIWIVNVGDIKPMEFPISFFLDYAWNPPRIRHDQLQRYTENWAGEQFGKKYAYKIAGIISKYTKYNGRRKPELLNENTYTNYNEGSLVTQQYDELRKDAELIATQLPKEYLDAYFQLVLHPVQAGANLQSMYTMVALNHWNAAAKYIAANKYADLAKQFYIHDSLLSLKYNKEIAGGKWNHMMDQTHIGYTYWQQPPHNTMPRVYYIPQDSAVAPPLADTLVGDTHARDLIPSHNTATAFYEKNGYVSMEADHFTKAINTNGITWTILPDHGKTGSAVTPFPVTAPAQTPGNKAPHLQYDVYVYDTGAVKINCYFSPALNFHNTPEGLQYAISIDDEQPQIISINKEDRNVRTWENWVANNIIIKTSSHHISGKGKHVLKFWMVNPGVVLQKMVMDFGGVKPSYLGPPETKN
jgi:hypothetical protein